MRRHRSIGAVVGLHIAAVCLYLTATLAVSAAYRYALTGAYLLFLIAAYVHQHVLGRERQDLLTKQAALEAAAVRQAQITANLSHEIRTPLNGVLGMAQLLAHDAELSPESRENAAMLLRSGQALLAIVNDVLDFAKMEAGRFELHEEEFCVAQLVQHTINMFASMAVQKGLFVEMVVEPVVPEWVRGDAGRVSQILGNFISNALKFTQEGGITVSVSVVGSEEKGKTELCFKVTDTGAGIPADVAAKLFQPFTQADASTAARHGGTGLGLAICKRLAEMMDGSIGVITRPGEGATFWVVVPVTKALFCHFEPKEPIDTATASSPLAGVRVLVAEDSVVNQRVVERLLARAGCIVEVVADGAAALAAVERTPFDVVLMDCQMPKMSGIEASRLIRLLPPPASQTPIVALTASVEVGDRNMCIEAGMSEFLSKPFRPEELLSLIQHLRSGVMAGELQK